MMTKDDDFDWDLECLERMDRRGVVKRFSDRDESQRKEIEMLKEQIDDLHEALASTEAELRDAREALMQLEAKHSTWMEQYDSVVRYGNELLIERDVAQQQLAEVLYILDQHRAWTGMGWEQLPVPVHSVEKIRSKVAQAGEGDE